ncbi:MAG TPA: NAD(+) diphosphatase [Euzebyales bacterium]|nr:NAD(+) diphosphatase [Euzebyales bacterium]
MTIVTTPFEPPLALARGTVDRADHLRRDTEWLATRWKDPATRVLTVSDGAVLVEGDPPALVLLPATDLRDVEPQSRWFLGLDTDGTALFAVPGALDDGARRVNLRAVGALLDDRDSGLMTTAAALEAWHASHTHCARCGAPTSIGEAGMVRICPVDESLHHPRVDPAVIMTIVDDDDRVLLGHQTRWPAQRFSTLAGFVEPGESLEQAVAREVREETGVVVDAATYVGSQPWPFPSSLMVGFHAHASTTRISVDEVEISDARWFSRDELATAVTTDQVRLPPRLSIARRLIERWHGAPLETT